MNDSSFIKGMGEAVQAAERILVGKSGVISVEIGGVVHTADIDTTSETVSPPQAFQNAKPTAVELRPEPFSALTPLEHIRAHDPLSFKARAEYLFGDVANQRTLSWDEIPRSEYQPAQSDSDNAPFSETGLDYPQNGSGTIAQVETGKILPFRPIGDKK